MISEKIVQLEKTVEECRLNISDMSDSFTVRLDEENKTNINIIRAVYGNEFTNPKNVNVLKILLELHIEKLKEVNHTLVENALTAIKELNASKPKLNASSIFK